MLIPQLQRAEEELERSVTSGSPDLVITWINHWRWQASELRGHFRILAPADRQLSKLVQASVTASTLAKKSITNGDDVDLIRVTKRLRDAIAGVINELGEAKVYYTSLAGDDSE